MGSDENDSGETKKYGTATAYDASFNGPLVNRSCTDIICLILFILYLIGMVAVGIIGFASGDPKRLIYPTDSNGSICGIDPNVADRPVLVFFDLTKCSPTSLSCDTPQVCQKVCPKYYYFHQFTDSPITPSDLNLTEEFGDPICVDGIDVKSAIADNRIGKLIEENQCTPYVLNSSDVFNRCLPEFIFTIVENPEFVPAITAAIAKVLSSSDVVDIKYVENALAVLLTLGGGAVVILQDIETSWHVILIGILLGTLLCFIWCFIMRYVAGYMIWGSILVLTALLAAGTALCVFEYLEIGKETGGMQQESILVLKLDIQYYLRLQTTWLIAAIVCGSMLTILLLLTLCLCNRIRIAIALIEEASRSVTAFWSTLFWPVIPFLLEMLVIFCWAVVALYLGTAMNDDYILALKGNSTLAKQAGANITALEAICSKADSLTFLPDAGNITGAFCALDLKVPVAYKYLQAYNLFGFLWLLNVIIGISHVTLAGTFATYYWSLDKNNVPRFALGGAFWRGIRFHMGSIAFGAAIIAIIQFIRILLEYLELQLKKGKDNPVVKYTLRCLKCVFWCLEKFMKFINKNAYIMVAIYGKNFCVSAKKAFFLLMRNIVRVAVINKITDFLLFIGTMMVTMAIVLITFFFYTFSMDYAVTSFITTNVVSIPDVQYYWVVIIIIAIGTFVISKLFFGVFDMAVDTLFLCFLEDSERNDGSAERPYYMGKNLMNIVGKKNKHSNEETW